MVNLGLGLQRRVSSIEHYRCALRIAVGERSAMPNRHSPNAALSPLEMSALRRAQNGLADLISQQDRDLLIRMGLAKVNALGRLKVTEAGRQRLAAGRKRAGGPTAQAVNPFDRPAR